MEVEKPFEIINKGRVLSDNRILELTDASGRRLAETTKLEITFHNKMWNDFSVGWTPHHFDMYLLPMLLRRVADKTENDLLSRQRQVLKVVPGEILTWEGAEYIIVDVPPGQETPTLVANWANDKYLDTPMGSVSVGADKTTLWTGCLAANKPYIAAGINQLYDKGKGRKVIIAGSGPSLQVDYLKNLSAKDWDIIACNDAYRLLEGKPRYAFFMEAEAKPKWWSVIGPRTRCINCVYSHPAITREKWHSIYWFAAFPEKPGIPSNAELGKKFGILFEQLNCTMSAFHLAYLMGYQTIAFVGCDFAYTNGQSHYKEKAEERQFVYSMAESVNGGLILTDRMLALQARCHEAAAYWMTEAGLKVYNCTENGIMLRMECRNLKSVIES